MIVRLRQIAPALLILALASAPAGAEIYKCRQGERVVYQETPCPTGSLPLTPPEPAPAPNAFAVEQARLRAKNDIAQAKAIRQREEQSFRDQEKRRAEAHKQTSDCAHLLGRIEKAEARTTLSKNQKSTLKSDQRKYRKECAPL